MSRKTYCYVCGDEIDEDRKERITCNILFLIVVPLIIFMMFNSIPYHNNPKFFDIVIYEFIWLSQIGILSWIIYLENKDFLKRIFKLL